MPVKVLVLYDSHGPQVQQLAQAISEGVGQMPEAVAIVKHISKASRMHLTDVDALVLGSPNWISISDFLKRWLDDQGGLWEEGLLNGKMEAAFTTGLGCHSGLVFIFLPLIHWMLAGGMVIIRLPWSDCMRISGYQPNIPSQLLETFQALGLKV